MPTLDVSSILGDPMFVTKGLCRIRNAQTVGTDGIAVNTPDTTTFSAVVVNDTGDTLHRDENGSHIEANITLYTRTNLVAGKDGIDADIVVYKGNQYTVTNVSNWDYGRGFVAASAELISLSGGTE